MNKRLWFRNICRRNNFDISENNIDLLELYTKELLSWNSKINLISRNDEEYVWERHILNSIALVFSFRLLTPSKLCDVGTGGGLPGIPIAILFPEIEVLLVDSIRKKVEAVRDILSKLGLRNTMIECARAEEIAKTAKYSRRFDYVMARAVAAIPDLFRWTQPFLRNDRPDVTIDAQSGKQVVPSGSLLLLKGGNVTSEIQKTEMRYHPRSIGIHPIVVDGLDPELAADKKVIIIQP